MKKFSPEKLSKIILERRTLGGLTQTALAKKTGINRSVLSNIENGAHTPSIEQLEKLSGVLDFEISDLFAEEPKTETQPEKYNITVVGTGYVGLSLAVLLAQHNPVTAVDILEEKVDKINGFVSPIQDDYIEKFLSEAKEGKRELHLTATTDGENAYKNADFIIIAAPTNYDSKKNFFDCSAVESIIEDVKRITETAKSKPTIVIKSTVPFPFGIGLGRIVNGKTAKPNSELNSTPKSIVNTPPIAMIFHSLLAPLSTLILDARNNPNATITIPYPISAIITPINIIKKKNTTLFGSNSL